MDRPSKVRRKEEPAYTSLWSLIGSPPASGPFAVQRPAAVKLRDPVAIDQWSRSGSPSTLPRPNTVYWLAPFASVQSFESGMPVPAQGLTA